MEKALKANANDPAARTWLPLYHWSNGDYPRALLELKAIAARWPMFWPARLNIGEILREQGDLAGAIREQERILEQDPQSRISLPFLARIYMDSGELAKARSILDRVRPEHRRNYRIRLYWALLFALEGRRTEALREMDGDLQTYAGISSFVWSLHVVEFYTAMGDEPKALEWLDRAARMGDDREDWLRRDPLLASLRGHPRFEQMLASVAYRRKQRER